MIPAAQLSPHSAHNIALARDTLTNHAFLASLHPWHRAELTRAALAILQTDRQARLGPRPKPTTPAQVIRIPLAVPQANRNTHPDPADPKDAA